MAASDKPEAHEDTTGEPLPAPPAPKGEPRAEADGDSPFPIVGIGASAGGLEALTQLLSKLPKQTGMAYLVVQHLDPRHESALPELLARTTKMPVLEATHGLKVSPDHVYVIPPNTSMALAHGILALTPREEGRGPHLPIDYLFRSLATHQQARAIGVVLSGTGSDGTQGICEIKAVGGITFAQDEKTAAHAGMPLSATQSGCVDFVLAPDRIAGRLQEIGRHPYFSEGAAPPVAKAEPSEEDFYQQILGFVRSATDVDFTFYRDTTIKRRIMRRMALRTQQSIQAYAERLKNDPEEVEALSRDLLINVTSFFRDPPSFEALKSIALPELTRGKPPNHPFRVWVPGCSTGQEAYSLAMTLVEFFDDRTVRPPIQIFATDLDEEGLERARTGIYPEGIEGELSVARLRRFFRHDDHLYRIEKAIRDMCIFARHNVTTDPPFSHVDLISCRNLLIYITPPLQKRIVSSFHYALDFPGYLMLGNAETAGDHTDLFEMKDREHRIYAKKITAHRHPVYFPAAAFKTGTASSAPHHAPGHSIADTYKEADRILLGRYAPPAVLIDENFQILQFRGRTSPFLEAPPGEPTTDLLKLAREGLFAELRNAVNEANKSNHTVRRESIRVRANGGFMTINIEVVPVRAQPQSGGTAFLVLFQDTAALPQAEQPAELAPAEGDPGREIVQLRQELIDTREYLQSLIEQQDASNEELRSANEEVLSTNEELQSTNEELETAKEELQSANEELTTVNEQLQRRNQDLDAVNNDLLNFLASTKMPLLTVTRDLRVRRFTDAAKNAMNLTQADVGRPIDDIKLAGVVPELPKLLKEVVEKMRPLERNVRDRDGKHYLLRIQPYRTADDRIDGTVMALVDVDEIRLAEQALARDNLQQLKQAALIDLSHDAIIVRDAEDRVISWNRGAEETYGWTAAEAIGQLVHLLLRADPTEWMVLKSQLELTGRGEGELHQRRRDGTPIVVEVREVLVREDESKPATVLAIQRDVSEHHRLVEALKEADRRKDEFLALLAHELRNPLAPIRNAAELMRIAETDPKAVTQAREVLDRQVKQLSRIVDDLIDVTRIVEKKIQLRKERVSLNAVMETALESSRSIIEQCKHRLTVDLPKEPVYLSADPVRLAQVFVNLLNNAAKYTRPGGEIWLTAKAVEDNAEVRVRDNGIGIRPEFLPHIFKMFMQGATAPEHGHGGLGVGLTLVQSLTQMHGGEVEAHSAGPDQGSEFIVRLPLVEPPQSRPAQGLPKKAPAKDRRILVIEDNEDQLVTLGELLKAVGHEVRLAKDGTDALKIFSDFKPDVVLLDIGLPGMSGYEVARRIRALPDGREAILIAQTGWGQESDRKRSEEAGFNHHLVKPVALDELQELLGTSPTK